MRFDKVIYFRYIPLTKKVYDDFYMKQVRELGIEVEYWDFSSLFFEYYPGEEDMSFLMKVVWFKSYNEIEQALRKECGAKTLFVSLVTCNGFVTNLFYLFTKYNCILAVFARNVLPSIQSKNSFLHRVKSLSTLNKQRIKNYLQDRNLQQLKKKGKIKGYDVIFLAGKEGFGAIGCLSQNELNTAKIIGVNSDDYDKCLQLKKYERLIESDYILFLDQYLPLHPDLKLLNLKSVDATRYYTQLNAFFDRVEKQYSLPVVIASHPKSVEYYKKDFFQGRRLFKGKSMELSRDASFVLAHNSTSVNLPVSFGVRLHFITSHDIEKKMNYIHQYTLMFAKSLDCHWQYFDEGEPVDVVQHVSRAAYDQYKWNFLTSTETQNKITEQIFIEFLKY